ncbi:MarR family winged helix-turn-helix transcriptional regulator [Schumannella sp. 10F1B-5-1]|uniref:MarR family winged helix-turn-helix transcriptional regulator n=1 Tax=Schumannella sp. 10F1B-5-1 TaxID=2590780 RepID=UPI001131C871|nr:MarR family transcriptional regulator [Schumannella sp. 10F1B-5-1]TPW78490.1 MarR family transcriptional regulator [Schumannella sp. 10F1B-5-1]
MDARPDDDRDGDASTARPVGASGPASTAPTASTPSLVDDPLALDRQLCFALVATARSVVSVYTPVLEPMGLTHPQYLVMLALWERSPRTLRDLAATLRLESATLSPLVKRLEAAGLVERRRDPADERALAVSLTDAGVALRREAEKVPGQVVERLGMSVEQLTDVRDALTGLLAGIER